MPPLLVTLELSPVVDALPVPAVVVVVGRETLTAGCAGDELLPPAGWNPAQLPLQGEVLLLLPASGVVAEAAGSVMEMSIW